MTTFAKSVSGWASQSKERVTAVYRRSVELLGEEMARTKPQGGRVPFLTGNLARSLLASKSGMPATSDNPAGSNVGIVAATLQLHEPVFIGYQANYARRRNYGFVGQDSLGRTYNESGDYFLEGAIASWNNIVDRAAAEVQN